MHAAAGPVLAILLSSLCAFWPSPALAALRSPQVPVQGSLLQDYLNSVHESINVRQDQQNIQVWQATVSNSSPFTIQVEVGPKDAQLELGAYDATQSGPLLMPLFSPDSGPGWFTVASFKLNPTRVVVSRFDQTAAFLGTHTYPGGNRSAFGFYERGPSGTFYQEDSRNPGAAARVLLYAGTGINSGSWWMAFERTSRVQGSNADFDDAVVFLESVNVDPVQHSSWGQVKARFR